MVDNPLHALPTWSTAKTVAHLKKLEDQTKESYMIWVTISIQRILSMKRINARQIREELRFIPLRQLNVINSNATYLPCIINAAVWQLHGMLPLQGLIAKFYSLEDHCPRRVLGDLVKAWITFNALSPNMCMHGIFSLSNMLFWLFGSGCGDSDRHVSRISFPAPPPLPPQKSAVVTEVLKLKGV